MHPNVFNPIFPPNFAEGLHFSTFHLVYIVVSSNKITCNCKFKTAHLAELDSVTFIFSITVRGFYCLGMI